MLSQAQGTSEPRRFPLPVAEETEALRPVRLGLVLDSFNVPGWLYYLIEKVARLESIELALVLMRPTRNRTGDRSSVLFRAWEALDKRLRRSRTDALQERDCRSLLKEHGSVPIVQVRGNQSLEQQAVPAAIRKAGVDLLLHVASGTVEPTLSECARLGVWSLECSSSLKCGECELRNVPSAFREMCNGETVFSCGLSVIARTRNGAVTLFRTAGITNFLSLAVNQNTTFWKVTDFLITQLSQPDRLHSATPRWNTPCADCDPPCPRASTSSNMEMAHFLVRWSARVLRNEAEKRLCREQWYLAARRRTDTTKPADARGFTIIKPPRNRFYADPFLIERSGRAYLFFEDYPFATRKGLISCCELQENCSPSEPRIVLEREYHLSYPFLLEFEGEVYMIPETQDNHTIEMYRATEFPYTWVFHKVLMKDVTAADSTLLHHAGKWWLFAAGVLDSHSLNDTLCLFFGDSPFGPWKAHPKNPVVLDPRRARPAGCLYFENGSLIRPGQDCSRGYGYAVQLNRVDRLTEDEYHETPLELITPNWIAGNRGTHTINQSETFQVLDARSLISRYYIRPPFSALPNNHTVMQVPASAGKSNRTK